MKQVGRKLFSIFIISVGIGACASTDYWRTRDYVFDRSAGILRAKEVKDDLPVEVCDPNPASPDPNEQSKAKCRVIMRQEYIQLRKDWNTLNERLRNCEATK